MGEALFKYLEYNNEPIRQKSLPKIGAYVKVEIYK